MLLTLLLLIPLAGIFLISTISSPSFGPLVGNNNETINSKNTALNIKQIKVIGLTTSTVNLFISFLIFGFFNLSSNQFQFVQEYHRISSFDFYLGLDGISIYFVLLTTIIMPISLLSN